MFGLLLTFLLAAAAEGACDEPLTPQLESVFDFEPRLAMSDLLPTISDACTLAAKQKVLFIGVDGFRADAAGMLPLPNVRKLQARGYSSFWATVQQTASAVSGPGWSSLLTGVEPARHGVDGNGDLSDISFPTVLKTVKDSFPSKRVAASASWDPIVDTLINGFDPTTLDAEYTADDDSDMVATAVDWIANDDFDLIFVDFDNCDYAGHSYGFDGYNPPYQAAVFATDDYIGQLLDAVLARDSIDTEEWLFVLTTDHGGENTSHGASNFENKRIPLIVAGNSPRLLTGMAPLEDPGSHMDCLPTIMHFFGAPIPSDLDGQVFGFADYVRTAPTVCVPDPDNCGCLNSQQSEYTGTIAQTVSGLNCQAWASTNPHSHSYTDLESNYCRNPDGEPRAWCYTTDPDQRWEVCAVPFCSTGSAPTPTPTSAVTSAPTPIFVGTPSPTPPTPVTPAPTSAEFPVAACHGADPLTCGCTSDRQASYRGDVALTISGLTCQAWDSQAPHGHSLTPDDVPDAGLESNYCRNPDGEDAAWCYTTDPNVRWELCAVPTCDACDAADPDTCGCPQVGQADYRGTMAQTADGTPCQAWDSQFPHAHSNTPEQVENAGLESNYCRNPDGEPVAWCYTTDPNNRWDFCDVPACGN
jgi:hypothetical protein